MTHFNERLFALQSQEPLPATQDTDADCDKIAYGSACVRAALPIFDELTEAAHGALKVFDGVDDETVSVYAVAERLRAVLERAARKGRAA